MNLQKAETNNIEIAPLPDDNRYFVSKKGNVFKKLKPSIWSVYGHLAVRIGDKTRYIHRLVLETFVGPCPNEMETRHLNGKPQDNRLENLCWGTRSENQLDSVKHGTHVKVDNRGKKQGRAKLKESDVRKIMKLYHKKGLLQREIALLFGVSNGCISAIITRKSWWHLWI